MRFSLLSSFAIFLLSASASAGVLEQENDCNGLSECWGRLFPALREALASQGAVADWYVRDYERAAREKLENSNRAELDFARRAAYEKALVRSYLSECESLAELNQSGAPADVIVLGKPRDTDGKNFQLVAMNYYNRRVTERCGSLGSGSPEYESCRKRIVILSQPGKERLLGFLRMLKPGSVSSFTYVGHGAPDQVILGERTVTRVHNDVFLANKEKYSRSEDGALYSEDLGPDSPFSQALSRAFRRDAKVSLVACETGAEFASVFGNAAKVSGVYASTVGMHFAVFDGKGHVVSDPGPMGVIPTPADGQFLDLVPDKKGEYRKIRPASDDAVLPRLAGSTLAGGDASSDAYARRTALMLSTGAATATRVLNDGGASLIVFTEEERRQLRSAFSSIKGLLDSGKQQQILNSLKRNRMLQDKVARVLDYVLLTRDSARWAKTAGGTLRVPGLDTDGDQSERSASFGKLQGLKPPRGSEGLTPQFE